jgi:Fe2+ transport system protein FeoA
VKTDFNSIPGSSAGPPARLASGTEPVRRLADLAPGEAGTIARVESETGIGRRLLDLGFIPGTLVRVIRRAPLGDPVSFEIRGTRMCLRRSEASRIWVEAAPRAGAGA